MKKIWKYFLLLLSTSVTAQNLVPNPSFEDTVACPTMGGQINLATGWENWGITPDYFNSCNTSGFIGTPVNGWGYQVPADGNAYAGLACNLSTVPNVREFTGRQLSQPLIIGQNYFVSLYVALSDIPSGNCAINKLGMKFSTVTFNSGSPPPLTNSAHVYTTAIVSDSVHWTRISGWFNADSAYDYIMLGNFFDNGNIDTLNCPTTSGTVSYYFFDMICVSTDSLDCPPVNLESIKENNFLTGGLKIYPQPSRETLHISSPAEIKAVEIYSIIGKLIYTKSFNSLNHAVISVENIPNGIYLIKVNMRENHFISKIQIIH